MWSSVIIPSYNNSRLTIECVDSLVKFTPDDVDIIIVDDHSEKQELQKLLAGLPKQLGYRKVNISVCVNNLGFSRACNEGAKLTTRRSHFLIFLNNDTIVTESWHHNLINNMREDVGICGSKLLYPEDKYSPIHLRQIEKGTIQHAGIIVNENLIPYHVWQFEKANKIEANICRLYPYVTGASFCVRKSDFEDVGGFNTKYINGCEDLDFCIKIRQMNKNILYVPDSIAYHHETSTRCPETNRRNLALFVEEHKQQLENDKNFEVL